MFFDAGRGFNERDSVTAKIPSDGKFRRVDFPLRAPLLRALRFDPTPFAGTVRVRKIELRSHGSNLKVELAALVPVQDIASIAIADRTATIRTSPQATDPILVVRLNFPIRGSQQFPWSTALRLATLVGVLAAVLKLGHFECSSGRSRPWLFPIACVALAVAVSMIGFNGSSSAWMEALIDSRPPTTGVLLGTAKRLLHLSHPTAAAQDSGASALLA